MAVRKCEGVRSAVMAVQQAELVVAAAKEPEFGVPSMSEVMVAGVFVQTVPGVVSTDATNVDACGQMALGQKA